MNQMSKSLPRFRELLEITSLNKISTPFSLSSPSVTPMLCRMFVLWCLIRPVDFLSFPVMLFFIVLKHPSPAHRFFLLHGPPLKLSAEVFSSVTRPTAPTFPSASFLFSISWSLFSFCSYTVSLMYLNCLSMLSCGALSIIRMTTLNYFPPRDFLDLSVFGTGHWVTALCS